MELEDLARRMQAGDEAAVECFLDTFRERIVRVFARHGLPRDVARELTLDVISDCWAKISEFQGGNLEAWVFTKARFAAKTWWRREHRLERVPVDDNFPAPILDETEVEMDCSTSSAELAKSVQSAINDLSESDGHLIRVCYFESGDSSAVIAAGLNIKPAAVRKRLERARARLKTALQSDPIVRRRYLGDQEEVA